MKLNELIKGLKVIDIHGSVDKEITGVNIDSRLVEPGHLFFAVKGTQTDGHNYIDKAIELGAVAIILQETRDERRETREGVTFIQVEETQMIVGEVATRFYGDPSSRLKLVGVTGTNGKTTTCTVLYNMFLKMGHKTGLLSTVCNYINRQEYPTAHTTPDPITLNRMLSRMADEGCEYVFMEVSSHAISQNRIGGLKFAGGVFTNITRDHLDYHKTFENYLVAKKTFFDNLNSDAFAITNIDDKHGLVMVQNTKANIKTYSTQQQADFSARIVESHFEGMYLNINGKEVGVHFIGKFNVYNLLAIYGTAIMLGKSADEVLVVMSDMKPVNGRFEAISSPKGFTVIVDYAHTPDALDNVLKAIHGVMGERGRVITVCGAGGNRDKGKRPLMAKTALLQSDKLILTSDNPRFEDPESIINDMLSGLTDEDKQRVLAVTDRRQAIKTACLMAESGDVILLAGKGHENYQEIEGVKHHFDDHEEVRKCFG